MAFRALWKIAKGFLDEKTRKKIQVKGSDYLQYLLEFANKEDLPTFLGGLDETPFPSDKGPWQEYECVDNVLRKKGEKPEVTEGNQEEKKVDDAAAVEEGKPVSNDNAEEPKPAATGEAEESKEGPTDDKQAADEPKEEAKPADDQPKAQEPVEEKPAEDKPAEDKPADDQPPAQE